MKKLIAVILILAVLLPVGAMAGNLYIRFATVVDLEYLDDIVTADDGLGNLWEFYGVDYMEFDDLIVMFMDDNNTPDWIYDDYVLDAYPYYCDF